MTSKLVNRASTATVLLLASLLMFIQDWHGLEQHIVYLRRNWIHMPVWVSVILFVVACTALVQVQIAARRHDNRGM